MPSALLDQATVSAVKAMSGLGAAVQQGVVSKVSMKVLEGWAGEATLGFTYATSAYSRIAYDEGYAPRPAAVLAEVARRAADLIDMRGWTQGEMRDARGRMCAFGALIEAGASSQDIYAFNARACQWLASRGVRISSVMCWNDTPGRTAAEVTAMLRGAAGLLDDAVRARTVVPGCPCCDPGFASQPARVAVSA